MTANFPLWEDLIPITWDETDISTLTVWTSNAGPSGALTRTPDSSVYPYPTTVVITQQLDSSDPDVNHPKTLKFGMIIGVTIIIMFIIGGMGLFFLQFVRRRRAKRNRNLYK
jgi:hypothetical protein